MISAIILAAGESKRMGQPKMLMPWGKSTVIQTVISVFQAAGVDDVLVVTGGARKQVEALIGRSVQTIFNEKFAQGEMLSSVQAGLAAKKHEASAALICLGDQPQVQVRTVQRILQEYKENRTPIIVPSYQMHRGHPWLVAREMWDEMLKMRPPETPREFLARHAKIIRYIEFDSPAILQDIDTPEDYLQSKP
ncbi:MAG: nucleotidyltransferase family protein [Chloroflexi bacterium]|nr:nucleotidyltransferase family protein [Chloroflexota bacterium]MBI3338859.1 nucleotidyltransferase family protein [Chloroflexota bacterium]